MRRDDDDDLPASDSLVSRAEDVVGGPLYQVDPRWWGPWGHR